MTAHETPALRPYKSVRPRNMASFGRSILPLVALMLFAGTVVFATWLVLFLCGLGFEYVTGA